MKKTIILLSFCLLSALAKSQSLTAYGFNAMGISSNDNKSIYGELKIFTNRTFSHVLFELNGFLNLDKGKYHQFAIGLGLNSHPGGELFNAITIPMNVQITPFEQLSELSIIFELTPEYYLGGDFGNLRQLIGLRFSLGSNKDKTSVNNM